MPADRKLAGWDDFFSSSLLQMKRHKTLKGSAFKDISEQWVESGAYEVCQGRSLRHGKEQRICESGCFFLSVSNREGLNVNWL